MGDLTPASAMLISVMIKPFIMLWFNMMIIQDFILIGRHDAGFGHANIMKMGLDAHKKNEKKLTIKTLFTLYYR